MTLLKKTPTTLLALLVAVALGVVLAVVLTQLRGEPPASVADPAAGAPRTAEGTIARAQAALADDPDDPAALSALAEASLVRLRETGDPSWLTRADQAASARRSAPTRGASPRWTSSAASR